MNWQQVSLDGVAPQAWRNGGGVTRELLAWPSPEQWQVRLSVADVQAAGDFSRFPGIERWFAVLEGDGVVLALDGTEHRVTRADAPFRFHGGVPVHCTLPGGATRDFNLMAAPGRARMARVRGRRSFEAPARALLAVYAHANKAQLQMDALNIEVPPRHLAWTRLGEQASGVLAAEDALWMEVLP